MRKDEFLTGTRQLIDLGVFDGRSSGLQTSMTLFCKALEEDDNQIQSERLSTTVTCGFWAAGQHEVADKPLLTLAEAWAFLYKGMGNLGNEIYKQSHRDRLEEVFKNNSDTYSKVFKALWRTVFADQDGPCLSSPFARLDSFLIDAIKKFAPLLAQDFRSGKGFFSRLPGDYLTALAPHLAPGLSDNEADAKLKSALEDAKSFYNNLQYFVYKKDDISPCPHKGTHVVLTTCQSFDQWFAELPKGAIRCDTTVSYQIHKISDERMAINKGLKTAGIQIQNHFGTWLACNNLIADKYPGEQLRANNLITFLDAFKKDLKQDKISQKVAEPESEICSIQ